MSFKNSEVKYVHGSNIDDALNRMTVNDLERFFNLYKIITSSDPNVDSTIKKASMEQLLSGELLDKKHFNKLCMEKLKESANKPSNDEVAECSSNDYSFFDVYDHIESWKKRIHPSMNKIEDLLQEFKTISHQTSAANILKVPNVLSGQTTKNSDDDVITNSHRYLSNIDKYFEIGASNTLLSDVFHRSPAGDDDNITVNNELHSEPDKNDIMQSRNGATKDNNMLPLINEKTQQTLLVPSNTYLETENVTNEDEFEVKTYFKW